MDQPDRASRGLAWQAADTGEPGREPIVHWSEFDRGGHFAAMEAPDLFTGDVRKFFRALRQHQAAIKMGE